MYVKCTIYLSLKNFDRNCWCKLHQVIFGYMNESTSALHGGKFSLSVRIMEPLEQPIVVCEFNHDKGVPMCHTLQSNIILSYRGVTDDDG